MSTSFLNLGQPTAAAAAADNMVAGQQFGNLDMRTVAVLTALLAGQGAGAVSAGGATPDSGGGAAQVAPTPGEIEMLLSRIPFAEDGNVIRSEHLNALRAAVIAIARSLGIDSAGRTIPLTFSPAFLHDGVKTPWVLLPGLASKSATPLAGQANVDADGWMQVELPHGSTIESLTVHGKRSGAMTSFRVNLLRQSINDPDQSPVTLATLSLTTAEEDFNRTTTVQVSGAGGGAAVTAAALEDARRVDNSVYKYIVNARLVDAAPAAVAQINAVQILCKR